MMPTRLRRRRARRRSCTARRAARDSTVFIYYAGHGAPVIDRQSKSVDGLEKYLVPHDAVADDLRASGIAMDAVQQYFSRLDGRRRQLSKLASGYNSR